MRRAGPRFAFRRDPRVPARQEQTTVTTVRIPNWKRTTAAMRPPLGFKATPRVKYQDPAAKVRLLEIAASQTVVVVGASTCERVCSLPSSKSRMSPFSCPFPTREFAGLVSASLATGPRRFPNCQRSICGAKRAAHVDSLATSWQRSGFSNCRS